MLKPVLALPTNPNYFYFHLRLVLPELYAVARARTLTAKCDPTEWRSPMNPYWTKPLWLRVSDGEQSIN